MNVSQYIVRFLEEQNIDRIFTVVGGASLWIYKALGESERIRPVFTNHEQAAAMAADGWARIKNKPGVVVTINGPGMTNTVTGIAQAFVDSSPVILITGNSNSKSVAFERERGVRQYGTQDVRTDLIMSSITKKTFYVDSAEKIGDIMGEAFYLAMEGRPGPVCIEVPINIQSAEVPESLPEWRRKEEGCPDRESIEAVIDKICHARRPLVLAGQGVRLAGAAEMLNRFVTRLELPVVTSRMGIDVMESASGFFVGRPGNHGSRAAHFAIQTCDVMLVLGSRMAPNTTGYDVKGFSGQSYKILVDIDKAELTKNNLPLNDVICCDIKDFLSEALDILGRRGNPDCSHSRWLSCCNAWKNKYPVMQQRYYKAPKLSTYRVVDEISNLAGEGDYILSDTGSCCSIVAQVWQVKKGQRVFISGGLSAMGYWATAMGIGLGKANDKQVIVFLGDGSLQMNIQELATIGKYRIPLKLFVINNNGYQFVRMSQASYGFHPTYGTSLEEGVPIPDTEKIVRAYGLKYLRCDETSDLKEVFRQALAETEPIVCEVYVDEEQEVCPRLKSVADKDGKFQSPAYENLYPFLDEEECGKEIRNALKDEQG